MSLGCRASRHGPRRRPPWWPAAEPWPPAGPPWGAWAPARGRFLRRIGLLLGMLFVFVVGALTLLLSFIATVARPAALPPRPPHVWWIAGATTLLLAAAFVLVARAVRHVATPAADLLEATGRLAEGDYSVRVVERGPPEFRRLARAFNDMAGRLAVHESERRGLLAEIAHELRTPLSVVQGNVEGLLDGVYPRDDAHLVAVLEATRTLSTLIEDLRTLALAEIGALPLHREAVDLGALLHDVVRAFAARAETAGVHLSVEAAPDGPLVEVDPVRIRQVVTNLVTNALQHTPAGGGVRVTCRGTAATSGEVSVAVRDTGRGIAAADLPHIFTRFYKSADSRGSGLGLAIARQLVTAHGGDIVAESEVGTGTTVRFTLRAGTG
jgi:signal transduction histidine kinase